MWPKPEIPPLPKPKPLKLWNWLSLMVLIYAGVLFMTVFMLPQSLQTQTTMVGFLLIQLVITLTITGMCFGIRLMIYGYAEEKQKCWLQQEKLFHQHWQDWSMQSMVVLKSFLITPSQFSVDALIDEQRDIDNLSHKVMVFERVDDTLYSPFFEEIAFSLRDMVSVLPTNTALTVLIQGREIRDPLLEENLLSSFALVNLPWIVTFDYVKAEPEHPVIIDRLMDKQDNTQYLLITDQATNQDSTAFISALLLSHQELESITVESLIRRTMQTTPNELALTINQMQEVQPAFSETKVVWLGYMAEYYDTESEITQLLAMILGPSTFPDMYRLASCIGLLNHDLSYEAQLVLASQLAQKTQQTQLVVASILDNLWFTVVSPPIEENITELVN